MTTVDPTTHDPNSSSTAPAQIYIIRHGEKPADLAPPAPNQPPPVPGPPFGVDFDGNQDIHSLLPRGWQRSGALAVLFAPAVGALRPGIRTPGALFSPSYGDPAKTQSHRTYETIYGLSQRSGPRSTLRSRKARNRLSLQLYWKGRRQSCSSAGNTSTFLRWHRHCQPCRVRRSRIFGLATGST